MTVQTIQLAGRKYVVVLARDFQRIQRELEQARQDADDVAVAMRRRKEKPIPWEQAKKRLGLA